jgi:hypothetical protein
MSLPPQPSRDVMREALLTTAVLHGYAAKVQKRAADLQMGSAILAMVGTGDAECDRLRKAMFETGASTPERTKTLHRHQRSYGLPPHDPVLWTPAMLLEEGAKLLPPDEMETVRRRLGNPAWQIIVALGAGGATALCLPAEIVDECGVMASDPGDALIAAADAEGDE